MSELTVEYNQGEDETTIRIKIGGHELRRHHLVPIDPNNNVEALAYYVMHCLQVVDENRMQEDLAKRKKWGMFSRPNLADATP